MMFIRCSTDSYHTCGSFLDLFAYLDLHVLRIHMLFHSLSCDFIIIHCVNPYNAHFQFCRNSWLSLLIHKFQMMQATVHQMYGNYILCYVVNSIKADAGNGRQCSRELLQWNLARWGSYWKYTWAL